MNWPICLNKIFCYFADHEHYLWTLNPWNLSFLKQHLLSISIWFRHTEISKERGAPFLRRAGWCAEGFHHCWHPKFSSTSAVSISIEQLVFLLNVWLNKEMLNKQFFCVNWLVFKAKQHIHSSKKTWRCIENCKGLSGADLSLCQLCIVILEYCWNIDFAHYS